jgi:hypothetical protein
MPPAFEEAPLSCVAQVQKYAPAPPVQADAFILPHLILILSSHSL